MAKRNPRDLREQRGNLLHYQRQAVVGDSPLLQSSRNVARMEGAANFAEDEKVA